MNAAHAAESRVTALDAYLADRASEGFTVETRTPNQAIIVRRHPLYFLLRRLARGRAERRLVVSVDEHGNVTALAAQPLRW